MEQHTAAVITLALEQQKQEEQEQARRVAQEASASADAAKSQETSYVKEEKAIAKGKSFAVDSTLKVGVGIVPDITGPKLVRPDIQRFDTESVGRSQCTRCKKEYTIVDGKVYKLCPHCRELQRQRSKRWQTSTKLKQGACRRCGTLIPPEQSKFVLCPPCRLSLRSRKEQRYQNGKCIHCAGANDSTVYKVCTRCRSNDKIRRKQLEAKNCCNRCGEDMDHAARGRKVCTNCRSRKKTVAKVSAAAAAAAAAAVASSHAVGHVTDLKVTSYDQQYAQQAQQHAQQQAQAASEADQQVAAQLETNLFAQQ